MIRVSGVYHHINFSPRKILGVAGLTLCLSAPPLSAKDTFEKEPVKTETIDTLAYKSQLSKEILEQAPSPVITIAGEEKTAGIVVDVTENRLFRYDSLGRVMDGYIIASGKIGRSGKSITDLGIRQVDHVESYPYRNAYGTKRKQKPRDYGPNVLYLVSINPETGACEGSNGEFIHGNNNFSSLGKHSSKGCIRMENEVIHKIAHEISNGTYVLIK